MVMRTPRSQIGGCDEEADQATESVEIKAACRMSKRSAAVGDEKFWNLALDFDQRLERSMLASWTVAQCSASWRLVAEPGNLTNFAQ